MRRISFVFLLLFVALAPAQADESLRVRCFKAIRQFVNALPPVPETKLAMADQRFLSDAKAHYETFGELLKANPDLPPARVRARAKMLHRAVQDAAFKALSRHGVRYTEVTGRHEVTGMDEKLLTSDDALISRDGDAPLNEFARLAHELFDGLELRFSAVGIEGSEAAYDERTHTYYLPLRSLVDPTRTTTDIHEIVHALAMKRGAVPIRATFESHDGAKHKSGYEEQSPAEEMATFLTEARFLCLQLRRLKKHADGGEERDEQIALLTKQLRFVLGRMKIVGDIVADRAGPAGGPVTAFDLYREPDGSFNVIVNSGPGLVDLYVKDAVLAQTWDSTRGGDDKKFAATLPLVAAPALRTIELLRKVSAEYKIGNDRLAAFRDGTETMSDKELAALQGELRLQSRTLRPLWETIP